MPLEKLEPCPYCGQEPIRTTGQEIYPHRPDLYHKKFILCRPCHAYCGCHQDEKPLGRLADSTLRKDKQKAHAAFDPLWKEKHMSRNQAYKWLSKVMQICKKECHIGMFNTQQCKKAENLSKLKLRNIQNHG
jgi:hypothetical protein